jgi:protein TonB
MAFEAFLADAQAQRTSRPRRRRLTFTLSLIVHGALLAAGVAYSFWHVEELSPPTVKVTFMTAALPPPPPPPAQAAGGGEIKKKTLTPKPRSPSSTLVQPTTIQPKTEEPKDEPRNDRNDDDDDDRGFGSGTKVGTIGAAGDGTPGGAAGGVKGGAAGVTSAPARVTPPQHVEPQMGMLQKLSGADPDFPAVLRRSGIGYLVTAQICVSRGGRVDSVTVAPGADPLLAKNVSNTVKSWRYRPLVANRTAIPFCYDGRFEFKSE